jgi:hypothetical protein
VEETGEYPEKATDLPQVNYKLYHTMPSTYTLHNSTTYSDFNEVIPSNVVESRSVILFPVKYLKMENVITI